MSLLPTTRKEIMIELEALPPETLPELRAFIEFLRFKSTKDVDEARILSLSERWQAALNATFGLWTDREDVARDGVEYVQAIRRGHRLNDLLEPLDEAD